MSIWRWVWFWVNIVLKYGPRLLKIALEIYDDVERQTQKEARKTGRHRSSAEKAKEFDVGMSAAYRNERLAKPPVFKVAKLRETAWRVRNGRAAHRRYTEHIPLEVWSEVA